MTSLRRDQRPPGPVVVGVSVSGENEGALRYAAQEARRLGVAVRLVHAAYQVMPPPDGTVLVTYQSLDEVAEKVLSEVRHELAEIAADVTVETVARLGRPVDVLLQESETASVVVLQHHAVSRVRRIFTGSVSVGVTFRAHCPVVSVPDAWAPQEHGRVVVGLDEQGGPEHALAVAFAEAAARRASLTILHAWRLDRPYADLVVADDEWMDWIPAARQHLEHAAARWRVDRPEVPVSVEVHHEWPAEALVEASRSSDLLVLGRHAGRAPSFVAGSLARTMVGASLCPVLVVPEPEDVWELDADEIAPQT